MPRIVFYKDNDGIFEYETDGKEVILHCTMYKWSPSVLKKCYMVFGDFLNTMRKEGFERVCTVTPNPKFSKLFNGKFIANYTHEGEQYEVLVWELN